MLPKCFTDRLPCPTLISSSLLAVVVQAHSILVQSMRDYYQHFGVHLYKCVTSRLFLCAVETPEIRKCFSFLFFLFFLGGWGAFLFYQIVVDRQERREREGILIFSLNCGWKCALIRCSANLKEIKLQLATFTFTSRLNSLDNLVQLFTCNPGLYTTSQSYMVTSVTLTVTDLIIKLQQFRE